MIIQEINRNPNALGGYAPKGFASALMNCESIGELRALAPLPKDAEELVDDAVVKVGLKGLSLAADLMAQGLIYNLPDPMSVLELYWEKQSHAGHAKRSMTPGSRGETAQHDNTGSRIPIYSTFDDFEYGVRFLRAAARNGTPIDTTRIASATRNVNESIEDATINGAGLAVDGNSVPGLLNAPSVNTQAYIDNEAWTAAGHSAQDILDDVMNMAGQLRTANKFGPYTLYVNTTYDNELNKNFGDGVSSFETTIRDRIKRLEYGGANVRVVPVDFLPTDRTALVQMTDDVVYMVVADPTSENQ